MNDRQRLEAIIGVVCKYLPPDGIPANEAMSQIIALVDPLPEPVQEPVEMREVLVKIARFLDVVRVYAQDIQPKNELETDKPLHWKARELQDEVIRLLDTTPQAQPADHSEQGLDMVDHGDELTIAYLDGVHTGKQLAKREWVGLTDEEIKAACAPLGFAQLSPIEVARAIEAKLKEKNT